MSKHRDLASTAISCTPENNMINKYIAFNAQSRLFFHIQYMALLYDVYATFF